MNVESSPLRQPGVPGDAGAADGWQFEWLDDLAEAPSARITGRLNWRGFDVEFALDSLAGIDGRLSGPSLDTLPAALQQLVLSHCAEACLDAFSSGPLAGMALIEIHWHDMPVPVDGEFAFSVRRPGVRGGSVGWITVRRDAARRKLLAALVSQNWTLPPALALVDVTLQMGSVGLLPHELDALEPGDVVWIDDAELAPAGLRVHVHASPDEAARPAWIKRSELRLDGAPQGRVRSRAEDGDGAESHDADLLAVTSPPLVLSRHWLLGGAPMQRLDRPAQAVPWFIGRNGNAVAEGALVLVGRRVGLRITRTLQAAAGTEQDNGVR